MIDGKKHKTKVLTGIFVGFLAVAAVVYTGFQAAGVPEDNEKKTAATPTDIVEIGNTQTPTEMAYPTCTNTPTDAITPAYTGIPTETPEPAYTGIPADTLAPALTLTPTITLGPTATLTPTITLGPTVTLTPTVTLEPTDTLIPTKAVIPTNTEAPNASATPVPATPTPLVTKYVTPTVTNSPTPMAAVTFTPTPEVPVPAGTEALDFSQNVSRFDASFFTIACLGTYNIAYDVGYYNADGSYAGNLKTGDTVYAKGSNYYYKNLTTYRNKGGVLEEFTPGCGKSVYQVVIDGKDYYMNPADLYGSYMGAGVDASASLDETEAYCMADDLTEYYHTDIYYFDEYGRQQTERIYDVKRDGWYYFVSLYEAFGLRDNYITHLAPWGEIWCRAAGDPASFSETDNRTGHLYVWHSNTFFFMDRDDDGICEYEVTTEEWFRWKELN